MDIHVQKKKSLDTDFTPFTNFAQTGSQTERAIAKL